MSEPSGRGFLRRGVLILVTLVLSFVTLTVTPAPASADEASLAVAVTGTVVTGSGATSTLAVTATISNSNAFPVYTVTTSLWRSTARLRSLAVVQDALGADETPSGGALAASGSHVVTLVQPLQPGQSAAVTLSATLAELGLTSDASYWVGADVRAGTTDKAADISSKGRALATVPGASAPAIVRVVDLTSKPTLLRPNLFVDDSLATELTGRLSRLLDAAAAPGASWVIDPALYTAVTEMADGYRVVDGDSTQKGAGQDAAKDFLARLAALDQTVGYQSLFGQPDLVGAFASRELHVLNRAQSATAASGLTLPTLTVTSRLSGDVLTALGRSGATVLSTGAGSASPWVTANDASIVGATPLTAAVTSTVVGDSPASRASVLIALARAVGVQVRLLATADDLAADAAASPAWLGQETLAALTATRPTAARTPTPEDATGALTLSTGARVSALADAFALYGAAAPTSGLGAISDAQSSRAASEAWLDDPAGRLAYLGTLESRSDSRSGILLTATKNVTMSSESSQFPATVTNNLTDPITVRVAGYSDNSVRLKIDASDLVTIQPNDSETVLVTARATANGVVPVTLSVSSADGRRQSDTVSVSVEATNLGIVGWIIVVVSGVALAASTAFRILQVRRRGSRT